jgi:hypothetical protein
MEMIEILKITVPALLVFFTAYLMMGKMLRNDKDRRDYELRKNTASAMTPIRLRAYERLMLVLERTTPNNLIVNVAKPGMTNMQLHTTLLSTIRHEYSHNLSQQIYVSDDLWFYMKAAQESLLRLINQSASKVNPNGVGTELAELVINMYKISENPPTEIAMEKIKSEVREKF